MRVFSSLVVLLLICYTSSAQYNKFVTVANQRFQMDGKPYYYIGANYWYGAMLGSKGSAGDTARLIKELDILFEAGVNNLRVLVGSEGPENQPFRVTPPLHEGPGQYDDELLEGLDFFIAELGKRNMKAVLYLNNSWEWSGGYLQYLNWNGYGPIPYLQYKENTWEQYKAYATQFYTCEPCIRQYHDYVRFIIGRKNTVTGKLYTKDPSIMSWQIANEPRPFSLENFGAFKSFIENTAALIKSLDRNHLVSTGSEGKLGSENSMALYQDVHGSKNIDYLTIHIWPNNWGWMNKTDIAGSLKKCIDLTNRYINDHLKVARKLNKPLVLEEFGLPRDGLRFTQSATTKSRDAYFENIFQQLYSHARKDSPFAGCNFWAFGGLASTKDNDPFWKPGDPYTGDPPQEEQGLNSVFVGDTTFELVRDYNQRMQEMLLQTTR